MRDYFLPQTSIGIVESSSGHGIVNTMRIRLLRIKDLKYVREIVRANYSKLYEKLAVREIKDMFIETSIRPTYFVAEESNKVIGFAGFIQSMIDYGVYQIFWVNVHPKWQKRGIGRKMVSKIIGEIKKRNDSRLIILSADQTIGNQNYYKKIFGFRNIQNYEKGKSCLMSLSLEKLK
ncbi:MAG: GNAT family N-acetyltransferase [Chitinophagaceae bacterium]|nr:GNAT family N-acetyltransferase [Chitinophagaceae bacterium]